MVYSEQQYKILEEKIKKLEKENELKDKDNKLLKKATKRKRWSNTWLKIGRASCRERV